jgi:hypothetical protein
MGWPNAYTYHWDAENKKAKKGDHACDGDHLKIYNFDGNVIRVFY